VNVPGQAGLSSADLQAIIAAWQSGAISRDTMFELFRSGEILPDGRTNEDEKTLIGTEGNRAVLCLVKGFFINLFTGFNCWVIDELENPRSVLLLI
jgi:hypothetical protein